MVMSIAYKMKERISNTHHSNTSLNSMLCPKLRLVLEAVVFVDSLKSDLGADRKTTERG
jgi:hypothetical protein